MALLEALVLTGRGVFLVMAFLVVAGCGEAPATSRAPTASGGADQSAVAPPAPSPPQGPVVMEASRLEGMVAGKAVVYLFTAPGCTSCVQDVGNVQRAVAAVRSVQGAFGGRSGIQLIGVDVWPQDLPGDFAAYLRAVGLASTPFVWTIDTDGSLARRYSVVALGSTVLVDSRGKVRFLNEGSTDSRTLAQQLSQLS